MDAEDTTAIGFLRHVRACNNAVLPGTHRKVRIGDAQVGWMQPDHLPHLRGLPGWRPDGDGIALDPLTLPGLIAGLVKRGLLGDRAEPFDIRAEPDGTVLGRIDRGALPVFGIAADGVHLNGLVHKSDGPWLWVARRAADKAIDPGKLDHLAAGGVPAGLTPWQCLLKEAAEEAALPAELTARARHVATLRYAMQRPEGLRRDRLLVYDLDLPESFTPHPADGEMQGFELWPLIRVRDAVAATDDFKFNVNLVLIDLCNRLGVIDPPVDLGLSPSLAVAG